MTKDTTAAAATAKTATTMTGAMKKGNKSAAPNARSTSDGARHVLHEMLHHLESHARPAQSARQQEQELQPRWSLAQDDELATTLSYLSWYIRHRTRQVSSSLQSMEQEIDVLSNVTVPLMKNEFSLYRERMKTANLGKQVSEKPAEKKRQNVDDTGAIHKIGAIPSISAVDVEQAKKSGGDSEPDAPNNDNLLEDKKAGSATLSTFDSAVTAGTNLEDSDGNEKLYQATGRVTSRTPPEHQQHHRVPPVETQAILNGMSALPLFVDPVVLQQKQQQHHQQQGVSSTTPILPIHECCYYYESSPDDEFNHSPLPFVVGSAEFRHSKDVGLGGEGSSAAMARSSVLAEEKQAEHDELMAGEENQEMELPPLLRPAANVSSNSATSSAMSDDDDKNEEDRSGDDENPEQRRYVQVDRTPNRCRDE